MTITLYKYTGEKDRVDKSGDLIQVLQTSGQFKADTSVLSPTLMLSLPTETESLLTDEDGNVIDDVQVSVGGMVLDFNYFYVAEFRRYYFVSSIVVSSQSILIITGDADPLYSFKDQILENYALVERNEFDFDPLLEDTLIPIKLEKAVIESDTATTGDTNTTFKADFTDAPSERNLIVNMGTLYTKVKMISGVGDLPTIQAQRFGDAANNSLSYLMTQYNLSLLSSGLYGSFSAYSSFFKYILALPFDATDEGITTDANIYILKMEKDAHGNEYFVDVDTGAKGTTISNMSKYRVVTDFVLPTPSSFLDLNPFAHYELYLPFYGWYELQYNDLAGHEILVYYSVSYEDGSGEVYIYDKTADRIIFSKPVQVGIQLSISSTNAQELAAQKNAAQLNLAVSLIGAGVGVVGSVATGNALGAVGSGLSAVHAVTSYVNQKALMFEKASSMHNGPMGGLYSPLKVRLRVTKPEKLDDLNLSEFAHQVGRPLRIVKQLKTLSGFTQIAKIHLEGVTALDVEKRAIESSLLAGVIL